MSLCPPSGTGARLARGAGGRPGQPTNAPRLSSPVGWAPGWRGRARARSRLRAGAARRPDGAGETGDNVKSPRATSAVPCEIAGYGYCARHSRSFRDMRLHLACAPHGTPRAAALAILPQALRGGETVVCDQGYAGREFASTLASLDVRVVRPTRRDKPDRSLYLATIRRRARCLHSPQPPARPSESSNRRLHGV